MRCPRLYHTVQLHFQYNHIRHKKVKFHLVIHHEGTSRGKRFSATLSLTSALDGAGGQRHDLAVFPAEKKLGTHFAGGFECLAARMDGPKGLENRS